MFTGAFAAWRRRMAALGRDWQLFWHPSAMPVDDAPAGPGAQRFDAPAMQPQHPASDDDMPAGRPPTQRVDAMALWWQMAAEVDPEGWGESGHGHGAMGLGRTHDGAAHEHELEDAQDGQPALNDANPRCSMAASRLQSAALTQRGGSSPRPSHPNASKPAAVVRPTDPIGKEHEQPMSEARIGQQVCAHVGDGVAWRMSRAQHAFANPQHHRHNNATAPSHDEWLTHQEPSASMPNAIVPSRDARHSRAARVSSSDDHSDGLARQPSLQRARPEGARSGPAALASETASSAAPYRASAATPTASQAGDRHAQQPSPSRRGASHAPNTGAMQRNAHDPHVRGAHPHQPHAPLVDTRTHEPFLYGLKPASATRDARHESQAAAPIAVTEQTRALQPSHDTKRNIGHDIGHPPDHATRHRNCGGRQAGALGASHPPPASRWPALPDWPGDDRLAMPATDPHTRARLDRLEHEQRG